MTLQELYGMIGGDYDQALRVLRVEKLVDKHIRKFEQNGTVAELLAAGEDMDPRRLFESAHALKGISANLGLVRLSKSASRITEEYRPGNERKMTDDEVRTLLDSVREQYEKTVEGIRLYSEG